MTFTTIKILISVFVPIVLWIIPFLFRPFKGKIYKFLKLDLGTRWYYSFKKKKIYLFPKKQETRVSVSVLARIEKDGKFLLKLKNNSKTRQDSLYKPLGGVIKMTNNIEKILKNNFKIDHKTRYSSKNKDFRIFIDLKSNKIIHKALYSEKLSFYQNELIREIIEEMQISRIIFNKIFSFKKPQPIVLPFYTEKDFSVLGYHDYVHHIIFDLKIKNPKELKKLLLKKKNISWIDLKGSKNKTNTCYILDIKKPTYHFKNDLNIN